MLAFIGVISILVTVHELGHFLVARFCGVRVLVFSIGFGKRICGFEKNGTEYILSAIPLGGYVSMLDERMCPQANRIPLIQHPASRLTKCPT